MFRRKKLLSLMHGNTWYGTSWQAPKKKLKPSSSGREWRFTTTETSKIHMPPVVRGKARGLCGKPAPEIRPGKRARRHFRTYLALWRGAPMPMHLPDQLASENQSGVGQQAQTIPSAPSPYAGGFTALRICCVRDCSGRPPLHSEQAPLKEEGGG